MIQTPLVQKEIDLTNGNIDDLALEPNYIAVQIKVHLKGASSHTGIHDLKLIERTPYWGGTRSLDGQLESENTFGFAALPGWRYKIELNEDESSFFIKGLTVNGDPQAGDVLELKPGGQASVDLFLSSNLATVDVHVIGNRPATTEITVLLEDASDPDSFQTKRSAPDGKSRWTLPHAGRYRLYAFEKFDRDLWGNPELTALLASRSVVVEAEEGRHLRADVPLISAEDFETAARKTGF